MAEPTIEINKDRTNDPIEQESELGHDLNPQFGWPHEYLEDYPNKTRPNFDVEFLTDSDDQGKPLQQVDYKLGPINYTLNGDLPVDQVGTTDYMGDRSSKPTYSDDMPMLRNPLNYDEYYENNVNASIINKKASVMKLADIQRGDWVEVLRYPGRCPETPIRRRDRVGQVIDVMGNGWIVVENLKKEWIPAFAGGSELDQGVVKLDVNKLLGIKQACGNGNRYADDSIVMRSVEDFQENQDTHEQPNNKDNNSYTQREEGTEFNYEN